MKIVVIGGTSLIGSKTVAILSQGGHEVVCASPSCSVNSITGEGLKEAVAGAQVLIDLAKSPSFEHTTVMECFETSGRNLLAAETAAVVPHHAARSIVGGDRLPDNGYFLAKLAQKKLVETFVAAVVADVALAPPRCGIIEIADPQRVPFNKIVDRYPKAAVTRVRS